MVLWLGRIVVATGPYFFIEHVEELFTSHVYSMDLFDWFMDCEVGFRTSSSTL